MINVELWRYGERMRKYKRYLERKEIKMFSSVDFAMTLNEVECPKCKSMAQRQVIAYDTEKKEYLCECEKCGHVFGLKRGDKND